VSARRKGLSARVSLLTATALLTVTLVTAASAVSISPDMRMAVEAEPPAVWIAVASVVAIFALMLVGTWLASRQRRRPRGQK
jgi:hypothetical protein